MRNAIAALIFVFASTLSFAQVATVPPVPASPPQNIYAAGPSWSPGATPSVAGTAIYAHLVSAASGTYAFTSIDALPASLSPFTVTSNVGAGVVQHLFDIGKVSLYTPDGAGISWTGSNTGWQYNGGLLASVKLKGSYYLFPTVRFLKSSVPAGNGFQPIVGLYFGWGK